MTIGILLVTHGQFGHSLMQNAADVLNRELTAAEADDFASYATHHWATP